MTTSPGKSALTLILALILPILSYAQPLVDVNATNFPDQYFRALLQSKSGYDKSTGKLDVSYIKELNLNYSGSNYLNIKDFKGIEKLVYLEIITLPSVTNKRTYKMETLDVSGLPLLKTITNSSAYLGYKNNSSNVVNINTGGVSKNSLTMPLHTLIADNCPKLEEINVGYYTKLKTLRFNGSNNITKLNLYYTAIEELDISNLTNLGARAYTGSSNNDLFYDLTEAGWLSFTTYNCTNLKKLTVGDIKLNHLDISSCPLIETIDISGLKELRRFSANFGSGSVGEYHDRTCNHTFPNQNTGKLREVIMGDMPNLRSFVCIGGSLTSFDCQRYGKTLKRLNLEANKLTSLESQYLTEVTEEFIVSYNRIRNLVLPPNKALIKIDFTGNCLTSTPSFVTDKDLTLYYTNIARTEHQHQYIRIAPKTYKFKVVDTPEDAQYIEVMDDPTASQQYYLGITHATLGDPTKEEVDSNGNPTGKMQDPCYIYFTDDMPSIGLYTDVTYWYYSPYGYDSKSKDKTKATARLITNWYKVTVCRNASVVDFDPTQHTFYLVGDFNNWTPTEADRFIYDPDQQMYTIKYADNRYVHGHFRVWDAMTEDETYFNMGGHADEKDLYVGKDNHVYFEKNIHHKLGFDLDRHYTTYTPEVSTDGYKEPLVEMRFEPGETDNFIRIMGQTPTGVEGIVADEAGAGDGAVEYYNLQGVRLSNPAPGQLVIRRQGNSVSKVLVR